MTYGDIERARARLRQFDIEIQVGSGPRAAVDGFDSFDASERATEMMEAFEDPEVDLVLCATGGWNAIDVLDRLDWDRLADHPKPLVGFSDITVLTTAVHARLGWTTYYGVGLKDIAGDDETDYTLRHLVRALDGEAISIEMPQAWIGPGAPDVVTDDERDGSGVRSASPEMVVVRQGSCAGRLFGGNLGTLFLLQGTPYWPDLAGEDVVLCIEEDDLAKEHTLREALRRIESLLMQPGLESTVGLILGVFQEEAEVDHALLVEGLRCSPRLADVPIVVGAPFGHVMPRVVLPIGGAVDLVARPGAVEVTIAQRG